MFATPVPFYSRDDAETREKEEVGHPRMSDFLLLISGDYRLKLPDEGSCCLLCK